jgi:hypothetical protein
MVKYNLDQPKKLRPGVKYSCEALEVDPSQEGTASIMLKSVFGIPSGEFEQLFVLLPSLKYKLFGQVFCRPAPDYEMPRAPTIFNIDNTKVIPQWPTVKTYKKGSNASIDLGLSYNDVVAKWTMFANLLIGISKIDENSDAGSEIDKLVSRIFPSGSFVDGKIKFKRSTVKWPSDAWFMDTNYSIVRKLEELTPKVANAAKGVLNKDFNFETSPESIQLSAWKITKRQGLLHALTSIYRGATTVCYNFGAQLYKIDKKLVKV